jgi:hypothetical protein
MDRIGICMNGKVTMSLIASVATVVLALPIVVSAGIGNYEFLVMGMIFIAIIAVIMKAIKS